MDTKIYFTNIELKKAVLINDRRTQLAKCREAGNLDYLEAQPENESTIYISREDIPGVQPAGSVSEGTFRLAAQKIIDRTHRVASRKEIEGFLRLQADNLEKARALDARLNRTSSITVAPAAPRPKK